MPMDFSKSCISYRAFLSCFSVHLFMALKRGNLPLATQFFMYIGSSAESTKELIGISYLCKVKQENWLNAGFLQITDGSLAGSWKKNPSAVIFSPGN